MKLSWDEAYDLVQKIQVLVGASIEAHETGKSAYHPGHESNLLRVGEASADLIAYLAGEKE